MICDLVLKNRSYRAFDKSRPITREDMLALLDVARCAGSGMNLQPIRYKVLSNEADIATMLQNCRMARSLGLQLPPAGGEPTGFVLMFLDKQSESPVSLAMIDVGLAAQTLLLAATEQGFGGCMLASFNAARLCRDFDIEARYTPVLCIALGTPAEKAVIAAPRNGSLTYYRDAAGTHYVPKRPLDDILI